MSEDLSIGKVAKAAHAMQNVLLLLQAHTELLKKRLVNDLGGTNGLMVQEVQAIYFNTRRLSRLLDSLMIYEDAGQDLLNKKKFNFSAAVFDLIQEYRVAFPRVLFALRIPVVIYILADREKLLLAIRNLLENAIKYGSVSESARNIIEVVMKLENRSCRLTIQDQGEGIDPQDVQKVFLPFYRGRQGINKNGSGLGLAIAKEIVRLHGGKIELTSKKQSGVKVEIYLPL